MGGYGRGWGAWMLAAATVLTAGTGASQEVTTGTVKSEIVVKREAAAAGKRIEPGAPEIKVVGPAGTVMPAATGLRFNFRDVSLDMVLDYLSKAAGFTIVREASVDGRIDVVSHRELNKDEAVALLNTILNQKGFAAIRNGQTLTIVTLEQARKRDIPVRAGRDSEKIVKTDEMITQVIPVHYAKVAQLVQNLEPLLPSYAQISANESSNAIVLTATQTDVRRMVQIVEAMDTSISNVSTLKVYILKHADATELAKLIGDLFKAQTTSNQTAGGPPMGPMMMFMGRRGGGNNNQTNEKEARQMSVTAVADTRTNAVVVSAPDEVLPTIDQLVTQIDTSADQLCEIRVFTLSHADAQNTAQLVNSVFQPTSQSGTNAANQNQGGGRFQRFMSAMMNQQTAPAAGGRKAQESTVLAVADIRTNSVVVNADRELMEQVAMMIDKLDKDPAKDKKVFVYTLKYADAQQTAELLDSMFGDSSSGNNLSNNRSTQSGIFSNNGNTSLGGNSSNSSSGRAPSGMQFGF